MKNSKTIKRHIERILIDRFPKLAARGRFLTAGDTVKSSDHRRLLSVVAISAVVASLILVGSVGLTRQSEAEHLNRALLKVRYETQMFEVFTRNLVQVFDQALILLREEVLESGPPADISTWASRRGMLRKPLFQIAVIGSDGRLVSTTENASTIGIDLSDREHFRVHQNATKDQLFISKPLVGRASGRWSINMTRPVRGPDGEFVGVVVASVDPASFSDFLNILGERNDTVVTLIGSDGVIRARAPRGAEREAIGTSIAGFELERRSRAGTEGTYRTESGVDGIERLFAFRRLDDIGLMVAVGQRVDSAFAEYLEQRRLYIAGGVVSALLIIALGILLGKNLQAQDRIRIGQAITALQNQQARELNAVMDGCGAALVQTDGFGRIVTCNSEFLRIFHAQAREELIGQKFETVVADRGLGAGAIGRMAGIRSADAYPVRFESSFSAPGEHSVRRDIMWSWTHTDAEDLTAERFVGVGIDNTDLRAKEMMLIQSAKLASLGRLAATLNHEMVQPLNVVRLGLNNLATQISRDAPKEELLERIGKAVENIHRTGSILTRFRSLVRQDHGVLEIVRIVDAVHAATAMYEEQFRFDSIELIVRSDADYALECSKIELEQVFVNLLANARDAILNSRSGRKKAAADIGTSKDFVAVLIDESPLGRDHVRILFEDSGGGIPDDLVSSIFQPFFTTRAAAGGTGLGLAICRATVENLKGRLEVKNATRGALFTVVLPAKRLDLSMDEPA